MRETWEGDRVSWSLQEAVSTKERDQGVVANDSEVM